MKKQTNEKFNSKISHDSKCIKKNYIKSNEDNNDNQGKIWEEEEELDQALGKISLVSKEVEVKNTQHEEVKQNLFIENLSLNFPLLPKENFVSFSESFHEIVEENENDRDEMIILSDDLFLKQVSFNKNHSSLYI